MQSDRFLQVYFYRIGDTLIDTGTANQWHKVKEYLQSRSKPSSVVVTHHHEDHGGNSCRIQHLYAAGVHAGSSSRAVPIYASSTTTPLLEHGFKEEHYRRLIWGVSEQMQFIERPRPLPAAMRISTISSTGGDDAGASGSPGAAPQFLELDPQAIVRWSKYPIPVSSGSSHDADPAADTSAASSAPGVERSPEEMADRLRSSAQRIITSAESPAVTLVPVHTPGHCPDHHVIWVPERNWMFTADLFITSKPKITRFDEDLSQLLKSLRLAVALKPDLIFCAHRGPVRDGTAALKSKLQFWEEVQAKAVAMAKQGAGGANAATSPSSTGTEQQHRQPASQRHKGSETSKSDGHDQPPLSRSAVRSITRRILGREDFLYYFSLGDFSRFHTVQGLLQDAAASTAAPESTAANCSARR